MTLSQLIECLRAYSSKARLAAAGIERNHVVDDHDLMTNAEMTSSEVKIA